MNYEIEYSELTSKNADTYQIIDIRDENSFFNGHIMGAKNIPQKRISENLSDFNKQKELYIYCETGVKSKEVVQYLRENGFNAYSIIGGYFKYLKNAYKNRDNNYAFEVEESIRKKFHRVIFSKFCRAINDYELIQENDKIAVCISGGKDSMLMAKLFQELKKHNKFPFELVFLVMDPGYSKENREMIELNAKKLNVPITIFETDIFENVFNIEKSPCYICARMRRGHLYKKAQELGCNKIALGHHYDDVIETILMGMLYGAQIQTMMPKLHSKNFEGMELIRPMYLIREKDIKKWRDYNNLHFIQCACKFTDNCSSENCAISEVSKRKRVKQLIEMLKEEEPEVEAHIFKSVENVNLSTVIEYKDENNVRHNFKDNY